MIFMFGLFSSLVSINFSNLNTRSVKTMEGMFYDCVSLYSMDFSNLDLRNAEIMYKFCYGCESLTLTNFTNMTTLNLTSYPGMFSYCLKLTSLELPNFKAKNLDIIFVSCPNLKYINIQSLNCQFNVWPESYSYLPSYGIIKISNDCNV